MKKELSLKTARRTLNIIIVLMVFGLVSFGAYMGLIFNDLLVGQPKIEEGNSILTRLDTIHLDAAKNLMDARTTTPYPENLKDPFYSPPPPAP